MEQQLDEKSKRLLTSAFERNLLYVCRGYSNNQATFTNLWKEIT